MSDSFNNDDNQLRANIRLLKQIFDNVLISNAHPDIADTVANSANPLSRVAFFS